jgi:putative two-component system response regulator
LADETIRDARILIVSDDKVTARALERILRGAGCSGVRSTFDSRSVPALFARYQPDLILLSMHMPHASGLEVLATLRPLFGGEGPLPVIIVTGDAREEARQAALAAGAGDFVLKPVRAADVLPRVQALLDGRPRRARQGVPAETVASTRDAVRPVHDLESLGLLALAAEYRDDLTRGEHVKRVGQTSALLARVLNLPEDQVEMIRLAAPLHDLGKIAIPERILLKPGPLTADEYDVVKTHTTIGAAMLSGGHQPLLKMAARIALSHHERWDGRGFPQGLRGDKIPLDARIVAVADAFDAMNADRPYRKALSSEEVWEILVDGAGKQWDLAIVDALASLVRMEVQVDRPFDLAAFLEGERVASDPRR